VDDAKLTVLQEEWHATLDDAGFDVEQIRLYPFAGPQSETGNRAFYFTPGEEIHYDADFPDEARNQIEDANKHRDHHRIAVWYEAETPVLGARLRHELEHARQVERHKNSIYELNQLVLGTLGMKLAGLPGGGQLYNAIPMEMDANAASARFAWGRYGEATARKLMDSDDGVLFRSLTPPGPVESLPTRMLALLFQFNDLCDAFSEEVGRPFETLLEEAWPGIATPWRELHAVEVPAAPER
jgi:hypothetical protein